MKDQIKALDDRRVKAVRSDSQQQLKDEILLSKYFSQVLKFCCKTRIGLTFKKNGLFANRLLGIIIDKAHCVKKW